MPSTKKIAALERKFAGPYEAFTKKHAEAIKLLKFTLVYLVTFGHLDPSVLEGFQGPRFWPLAVSLIKEFQDHPGLAEARKHMPRAKAEWQAYEADPEGYLRACVEREQRGG